MIFIPFWFDNLRVKKKFNLLNCWGITSRIWIYHYFTQALMVSALSMRSILEDHEVIHDVLGNAHTFFTVLIQTKKAEDVLQKECFWIFFHLWEPCRGNFFDWIICFLQPTRMKSSCIQFMASFWRNFMLTIQKKDLQL